ncbi:RtcB family protein [candidate division TA06 bacterium]|nr:RtcB family protein [candidate division TA06 bacterium]
MFEITESGMLAIKSWCQNPEEGVLSQAKNLARRPFAFKHVCLMSDAHQGYGMPIGGVLATMDNVIPNAVGVDIGCGMCAVRTSLAEIDREKLKSILGQIRTAVPVGFTHHKQKQDPGLLPGLKDGQLIVGREYEKARSQIGTLGGGNHFIEIQQGDDGRIWIMIHSGSRNIGKQVADHYNKAAINLNEKSGGKIPKQWELAFLPVDSDQGRQYLSEMQYCVDFALANRRLMMERIKEIVSGSTGAAFESMINIAHNYARMENHFGKEVLVHRKGATSARAGEIGIIPGSQGTPSYIVKGLGNRDSFSSCSHGAGRRMGRNEARRSLDLEKEREKLEKQGILHSLRTREDLEEASRAYKDIERVIKEQLDLIQPVIKLEPLAVVKG